MCVVRRKDIIAIQGINVNFYGEFTINVFGYLEGVDWEKMTFGSSYRAWEIAAPEGYAKMDQPVMVQVNQADIEGI